MEHPKVMLVDVNSPEFEETMLKIFQKGFNLAIEKMKDDPFKDYGEFMKRNDVAVVFGRSTGWVRNRAININKANLFGRKIDYSIDLIEYKNGNRNPYYKTKEIRQYYERMKSYEGVGRR